MQNAIHCPCCGQAVDGAPFLADPTTNTILRGEESAKLTLQEFRVAVEMINAYPDMVSKDRLYDRVFLDDHGEGPEIKIVDVVICKIRPKLAKLGFLISTVWGRGYKVIVGNPDDIAIIKETSLRSRESGGKRWTGEHDKLLVDLRRRKLTTTQCATMMRMPYMAVQRHIDRLGI